MMRNDKKLSDAQLEAKVDKHLARIRKKTKEPIPDWKLQFIFSTSFVFLFAFIGYGIDNYLVPSLGSMGLLTAIGSAIGSTFLKEVNLYFYKLFLHFFAGFNILTFILIQLFLK